MENLKITFLGGVNEIGKNMTALEYGDDLIVIDSGQAFADETMPGVDSVVQDISYLIANKSKIRGIFITHGHEDHIGSINYLLDNIKAPIYGSRVSLGLIENKIKEAKKNNVVLKSVNAGTVVGAGKFKVEFVSMTHSIPGAMALVISTPAGTVVHTGDFKIDFTPVGNDYCDLKRLADVGKKGVNLLLCESTNVEREGFSMSESVVGKTFDGLFAKLTDKRIIIATFASNISRLQQIIDMAVKYKRKIAFTGRSMVNVSDMAIKLGELRCDKELIIDIDRIDMYADKELIIISTGSQGESMSALTRMVNDNFPKIKLNSNDAVILSSSPIPGNEKAVNNIINALYRKDCQIIYNELADVHASGHAYKEELKILHSLIKPRFFIPVHGEYRHLKNHQMLAKECGMKERDIIIPELGMQVEVNTDTFKIVGQVPAGEVLIDGTGVGDKDSNVIRDRLLLSQDGVCCVVCQVSKTSRQIVGLVDIISRGFIYQAEASDVISEAREDITNALNNNYDLKALDLNELKATIRKVATNYMFKKTKRKPVVLSVVVEVEETGFEKPKKSQTKVKAEKTAKEKVKSQPSKKESKQKKQNTLTKKAVKKDNENKDENQSKKTNKTSKVNKAKKSSQTKKNNNLKKQGVAKAKKPINKDENKTVEQDNKEKIKSSTEAKKKTKRFFRKKLSLTKTKEEVIKNAN